MGGVNDADLNVKRPVEGVDGRPLHSGRASKRGLAAARELGGNSGRRRQSRKEGGWGGDKVNALVLPQFSLRISWSGDV